MSIPQFAPPKLWLSHLEISATPALSRLSCITKGINLNLADLSDAILAGAILTGAEVKGAKLSRANLSGADLRGANLNGTDLSGADLHGANLEGAIFWNAILYGAKLGASRNLTLEQVRSAITNKETEIPIDLV